MISYKGFTIDLDTVIFIGTTVWSFLLWLRERNKLPADIQRCLDMISTERVESWIQEAAAIETMTKAQRHDYVSARIKEYAEKTLGADIPASFINIMVDYVYKRIENKLEVGK